MRRTLRRGQLAFAIGLALGLGGLGRLCHLGRSMVLCGYADVDWGGNHAAGRGSSGDGGIDIVVARMLHMGDSARLGARGVRDALGGVVLGLRGQELLLQH